MNSFIFQRQRGGGKLEKIKKVVHSFDKTRRLNKHSTWILNGKLHYIFLSMDRAHSKTKHNWTKCRPFQEGMFHSTVWFTQAKHWGRDAVISSRDQQGIYFLNQVLPMFHSQLHQCQGTVAILVSGTHIFRWYNCLWHETWMQEQFPYTWDHHQHSLEHETWPLWEKRPSWEKSFHLFLEKWEIFSKKSKPSAHRLLLWMSRVRCGF